MKCISTLVFVAITVFAAIAQNDNDNKMDRTEFCKHTYHMLFGGEALTGHGSDPEMMDILQKFIFGEVFRTGDLDMKRRELITCVTLATMQTLPQLKAHAGAALNVGVTPVELREAIYLTAPFIGFPRMLNAIGSVNEVFAERGIAVPLERQGTVTEADRHAEGHDIQQQLYPGGISSVMDGVPGNMGHDVEGFLTDYCFGEIYTRGGLDMKTREMLAYCILTTLEAESQLHSHFHGCMNVGNTPDEMTAAVIQCLPYIGFPAAIKALKIIKDEVANNIHVENNIVRLSKIVVDPAQLEAYNAFLKEEIATSMSIEPGVLTLYATAEKDRPNVVTILEIYADEAAYKSHIATPHFKKYKQGTIGMVQSLELVDSTPLIPGLKIK